MRIGWVIVLLFSLCLPCVGQYQPTANPRQQLVQFANGLNIYLVKSNSANLDMRFTFGHGSIYESDSFPGIAAIATEVLKQRMQRAIDNGRLKNLVQDFSVTQKTETTVFRFVAQPQHGVTIAEELVTCINDTVLSNDDFILALQAVDAAKKQYDNDPDRELNAHLEQTLFRRDAYRFYPYGRSDRFAMATGDVIYSLLSYYIPDNCLLILSGNTDKPLEQLIHSSKINVWKVRVFNRYKYLRFLNFKPIFNSSQQVISAGKDHGLSLTFLLPGVAQHPRAVYSAYLLAHYLKAHPQISLNDSTPPVLFNSTFVPGIRSSILTFQTDANAENALEIQAALLGWLRKLPSRMADSDLKAAKTAFYEDYNRQYRERPLEFAETFASVWWTENTLFYLNLPDSLQKVELVQFQSFISDYVSNVACASVLQLAQPAASDSSYASVDDAIRDLIVPFSKNSTDYNDSISGRDLFRLLQWLKINDDYEVQVNGFADDGEYFKVREQSIFEFIDTFPTFKKIMPDIIDKGYIRLEMVRALKIIRFLYMHGIPAKRLLGTSRTLKSDRHEDPAMNRKCTFTFHVARQRPTLYEKYYGRPKPQP